MTDLRTPIFAAGDTELFARPFVAVVGTRHPSPEGLACARELATAIARAGLVVASGLALGVDGAAHRAAIAAGGRTVALLGTPLDRVYPAAHRELQARIARDHLLLSPFSWGEPVTRGNFPRRDRVLAGLSEAVVVIEAGELSGTLHTVREAARLGRPILLAAPVIAARCAWATQLLAAGKARPVTRAEDWCLATKRIVVATDLALDPQGSGFSVRGDGRGGSSHRRLGGDAHLGARGDHRPDRSWEAPLDGAKARGASSDDRGGAPRSSGDGAARG